MGPGFCFYDRGRGIRIESMLSRTIGRGPQRNQGRAEKEGGTRAKGSPIPKTLKYDGKTNWQAFYAKFARYADCNRMDTGRMS